MLVDNLSERLSLIYCVEASATCRLIVADNFYQPNWPLIILHHLPSLVSVTKTELRESHWFSLTGIKRTSAQFSLSKKILKQVIWQAVTSSAHTKATGSDNYIILNLHRYNSLVFQPRWPDWELDMKIYNSFGSRLIQSWIKNIDHILDDNIYEMKRCGLYRIPPQFPIFKSK